MYQYQGLEDTIAAISTPSGRGGIGVVRVSGKDALTIADALFVSKTKKKPSHVATHTLHYGWIQDKEIIDEVLLSVMRAPRSYTTEDVVEINCHGGGAALKAILHACLKQGARLAEPGEFTKRAFLHGRMDLTQAEAVLDVIQSRSEAALRISTHQLKGDLSAELEDIRSALMASYVEIEAIVNFPEDEIDARGRSALSKEILRTKQSVDHLLSSGDQGRLLREGIQMVLCGKPNVGKSSLLNVLLKTQRAIVSDIAGTTRDSIEESAHIQGIPFQIIDTAGILHPRDVIEEEAVARSRQHIAGADLVLLLLDASLPFEKQDEDLIRCMDNPHVLVVYNKTDLPAKLDRKHVETLVKKGPGVEISAKTREGLQQLEDNIAALVRQNKTAPTDTVMVSNIRHIDALRRVSDGLAKASSILLEGISLEFVSEEIKVAVNILDSITGRDIDHDLIDTIFTQFCIGK